MSAEARAVRPQDIEIELYQKIAVEFASALVEGDFAHARTLLTSSLQKQLTQEDLHSELYGMFRGYASGEPNDVRLVEEGVLEDWPDRKTGDIRCVYVAISGDDFNEAVYVTVTDVDGVNRIRKIDWGRP